MLVQAKQILEAIVDIGLCVEQYFTQNRTEKSVGKVGVWLVVFEGLKTELKSWGDSKVGRFIEEFGNEYKAVIICM